MTTVFEAGSTSKNRSKKPHERRERTAQGDWFLTQSTFQRIGRYSRKHPRCSIRGGIPSVLGVFIHKRITASALDHLCSLDHPSAEKATPSPILPSDRLCMGAWECLTRIPHFFVHAYKRICRALTLQSVVPPARISPHAPHRIPSRLIGRLTNVIVTHCNFLPASLDLWRGKEVDGSRRDRRGRVGLRGSVYIFHFQTVEDSSPQTFPRHYMFQHKNPTAPFPPTPHAIYQENMWSFLGTLIPPALNLLGLFLGRPRSNNDTVAAIMEATKDAQRNEQAARKEAEEALQKVEAARREADEARQKAEDAFHMGEEALKQAKEMEAKAAEAVREKERLAKEAKDALHKLNHGIQPIVWPTTEELAAAKARAGYREDRLHFAVCGPSGSGKSSLINAVRGLKNGQEGSAKTGVVECTEALQRYPDPRKRMPYPRFVWYDVPGAGTSKIPGWQYFNRQGLFIFDFIILVYDMVPLHSHKSPHALTF